MEEGRKGPFRFNTLEEKGEKNRAITGREEKTLSTLLLRGEVLLLPRARGQKEREEEGKLPLWEIGSVKEGPLKESRGEYSISMVTLHREKKNLTARVTSRRGMIISILWVIQNV